MKLIIFVAVLLLASGAWGQAKSSEKKTPLTNPMVNIAVAVGEPLKRVGNPVHVCRWELEGGGFEYNACPSAKQKKKAPPAKLSKWDAAVPPCDSENLLPCWEKDGSLRVSEERDFDWSPFTSEDASTPPFDVPPKESYKWEPPLPNPWPDDGGQVGCVISEPVMANLVNWACINGVSHHRVHRRVCADKKRVLLMSEDKIWHCYNLSALDRVEK